MSSSAVTSLLIIANSSTVERVSDLVLAFYSVICVPLSKICISFCLILKCLHCFTDFLTLPATVSLVIPNFKIMVLNSVQQLGNPHRGDRLWLDATVPNQQATKDLFVISDGRFLCSQETWIVIYVMVVIV